MATWFLILSIAVVTCIAAVLAGSAEKKPPPPPKPPKVKPENSAKLPNNIKFFTVQIDELWFKEDGTDNSGFYPDLLDLIGTELGYDIDTHAVEKAKSFDEAIKKMNDFHGSGIFLGAVEKDGIYKDLINFTVPIFTAAYVQVYPAGMDETTRATLDISTLNFTDAQDSIAGSIFSPEMGAKIRDLYHHDLLNMKDPKTAKKLSADQRAKAAAGNGGKPADLQKALKDVQEKNSIFVGRTPVLEKLVRNYPDLKIQPVGDRIVSRFGFGRNSLADPQFLEKLNTAILKMHRDCSIYRLWTTRFPTSTYIDPTGPMGPIHSNNDNIGKKDSDDGGCAAAKDNNGNGPERRSLRMQQMAAALEKADPALVRRLADLLQTRLSRDF